MIAPGRKPMLWVIATLAVAMTPQLLRMPLPVAVMTLLPLMWRFGFEYRGWHPLPTLVRHTATGLAVAALFMSYGNLIGRRAAVSLLTVMLALKLVECFRLRDARLIVSFSLFLSATQFLFAQGIFMPFYGGFTVIIALVALTQLHRAEAFAHIGDAPAIRTSLFSELGFSFRLLALATPVALALFLLFPRWASPLWGVPESTLDGKTGLSDSMAPGSIESLFMDDSPAFRAEFAGAVPAQPELYWRGPVLWNFDGNRWSSSYYGRNIQAESRPGAADAPWRYTVQLEPNERRWLFALDYPAMTPRHVRVSMDYQLIRSRPVTRLLEYSMASNPDFIDMPELKKTLRDMALDLPDGFNPKTREMMDQWRRETPDDLALIRRTLNHFNEQEFHYSLQAPLLGTHTVDDFLFKSRTGYCEHYASTFAVMMRMAGIPARVVTGYQGGWFNELGNYLLIRQSDAHAWTEVWLPQSGWTRVDPTAAVSPLRVEQGSLGALSSPRHFLDYFWLRKVRNGFDIVQQRWNDLVIDFDADRQSRMFEWAGLERMNPNVLVTVLMTSIGIFSVLLLPFILRVRGPGHKDPIHAVWHRFLKRLKKAGFEARPSSGAIELGHAAAVHLPGDSESIFRISDLYNRCRYSANPPEMQDFKAAVKEFHPKWPRKGKS
jgi:transglutaminase-like putative cysteine protease